MRLLIIIFVLTLTETLSYAQGVNPVPADSAIRYSKAFLAAPKYFIGGKQVTLDQVKATLITYQPSAIEFNEYKKYRKLELYSGVSAISFLLAALVVHGGAKTNNTSSNVLLYTGYGLIVPTEIFGFIRNKHFRSSLKLYNERFK